MIDRRPPIFFETDQRKIKVTRINHNIMWTATVVSPDERSVTSTVVYKFGDRGANCELVYDYRDVFRRQ